MIIVGINGHRGSQQLWFTHYLKIKLSLIEPFIHTKLLNILIIDYKIISNVLLKTISFQFSKV